MKTIAELKQNSEEWHEWRKQGLGASEANIIMGKSKFMTPLQLWEQKVNGPEVRNEEENTFIQDKGHRIEAKCRPYFELEIGSDFPDMIAVHSDFPWLRASLDGFSEELNATWECKYCGQDDFNFVVENNEVLPQYKPQVQHQLMVTGAEKGYFFVCTDDKENGSPKFPYKTHFIEVSPDWEYIEKDLLPSLVKFWGMVEEKKAPKLSKLDVLDLSNNEELNDLLFQYNAVKTQLTDLEKEEKELKKAIFKITKHDRAECNGIKITKSKSDDKIGFDYKKFEKENGIPEGFSKITKGRITQRITFPKVEE